MGEEGSVPYPKADWLGRRTRSQLTSAFPSSVNNGTIIRTARIYATFSVRQPKIAHAPGGPVKAVGPQYSAALSRAGLYGNGPVRDGHAWSVCTTTRARVPGDQ